MEKERKVDGAGSDVKVAALIKGDNHHEDPVILFSLTSSRMDSIHARESLYRGSMHRLDETKIYSI